MLHKVFHIHMSITWQESIGRTIIGHTYRCGCSCLFYKSARIVAWHCFIHGHVPTQSYGKLYYTHICCCLCHYRINCLYTIYPHMHTCTSICNMISYPYSTKTSLKKIQLVGVTSLFIASKLEETNPPYIGDFEYIAANTYSKRQIRAWEGDI